MTDTDLFSSHPDDCDFHPAGWIDLGTGVEVTALPLWDSRTGIFARLGPLSAARRLVALGARFPTPAEVEEHRKHTLFIAPYPMSDRPNFEVHMRSLSWCREHDTMVGRRILKASGGKSASAPAQNAGKHWTAGGGIFGWFKKPLPSRAAIQGYHQDGTVSFAHAGSEHTDYATTTLAVRDIMTTRPTKEAPPMPKPVPPPQPTKLGDKGEEVKAWQRYLIIQGVRDDAGAQVKVDGDHGPKTEQATARWRIKMSQSEPVPALATGVDVSSWQPAGKLDDVLLGKDHRFLIARAAYGVEPDIAFEQHAREARAAGLKVGAYLFYRQSQSAKDQLTQFVEALRRANFGPGDIIPALDLETNEKNQDGSVRDGKPQPAKFLEAASEFVTRMKQEFGCHAMFYIAPYFWLELGSPAWLLEHHIWIADWSPGVSPPHWGTRPWDIWQVSAKHRHKAFPLGPLDLNRARRLPLVS